MYVVESCSEPTACSARVLRRQNYVHVNHLPFSLGSDADALGGASCHFLRPALLNILFTSISCNNGLF